MLFIKDNIFKDGIMSHLSDVDKLRVREYLHEGGSVYKVTLLLDTSLSGILLGIRIIQVLTKVGIVLEMKPSGEELIKGTIKDKIHIILVSKLSEGELEESLKRIPGFRDILIEKIPPPSELLSEEISGKSSEELIESIELRSQEESILVKEVKVNIEVLDRLFSLIKELSLIKSLINEEGWSIDYWRWMERVIKEVSDYVVRMRLVPLNQVFPRLHKIAIEISKEANKEVDFIFDDGGIALDKGVADELVELILSLIRNSIEHGIEPPEERIKRGKISVGTVKVRAWRSKDYAIIEVEDDGKGISLHEILHRALKKGIINEHLAKEFTYDNLIALLTLPGISERRDVPYSLSLNAIKFKIESLGGSLDIWSREGEGTRVTIRIPISIMAISTRALMTKVGDLFIALPAMEIIRIIPLSKALIKRIGSNASTLFFNEELIPLIDLRRILYGNDIDETGYVVITRGKEGKPIGVIVNEVYSLKDILVKSIPSMIKVNNLFSGIVVLNRDHLGLVLDVSSL